MGPRAKLVCKLCVRLNLVQIIKLELYNLKRVESQTYKFKFRSPPEYLFLYQDQVHIIFTLPVIKFKETYINMTKKQI